MKPTSKRLLNLFICMILLSIGLFLLGSCSGGSDIPDDTTDIIDPAQDTTEKHTSDEGITPVSDTATPKESRSFYVSPTGNDVKNGRTPETAFRSPQRAVTAAKAGDTVYFMGGTYECRDNSIMKITTSGKEDAYITFTNYEDEKPVLKCGGKVWDAVYISASYIIIDGLTFIGINDELTVEEAQANYDAVVQQYDKGIPFDNGTVARTNTNGILINGRSQTAAGTENPHHIIVRNCEVSMFPAAGIATLDADYFTAENNVVYNNMWYSIYGSSGISVNGSMDVDDNTTDYKFIIRDNLVYNNKSYVMCHSVRKWTDSNGIIIDYNKNTGIANKKPYKGKTLVENNICYQNGGAGIISYNSENVDIINNTCVDNGQVPELAKWGNIKIGDSSNVNVINNIAIATRAHTLTLEHDNNNKNIVFENNIHFNTRATDSNADSYVSDIPEEQRQNNAYIDPQLVDLEGMDLHLADGSPAIDAGIDYLAPDTDFDGNARPHGAAIDIGAYEYGSSTT